MSKVKALLVLSLILTISLVIGALLQSVQSGAIAEENYKEKRVETGWTVVSGKLAEQFNQIQFIDESHGWGLSSHALWKTSDGGQTWMEVRRAPRVRLLESYQPQALLWKMQFLSLTEGWLLEGQNLIHTLDAGASWKTQDIDNAFIRSFAFLDRNQGWIVVGNLHSTIKEGIEDGLDAIYTTIDGGSHWRKLSSYLTNDQRWRLLDVVAISPNSAWVVGDAILDCNIGKKCTQVSIAQGVYGVPSKVRFTDSNVGWIMTNQGGKYLVTNDEGKSWDVRSAPTENGGFTDLVYTTASTAWGIMSDGIYQSNDGGKSWTKAIDGNYSSIHYLKSTNTLFAAGDTVIKYSFP